MATSTLQRAKVFINASSGFDEKQDAPERLQAMFEAAGIRADVEYVRAGVNLAEKSREAVAAGVDMLEQDVPIVVGPLYQFPTLARASRR